MANRSVGAAEGWSAERDGSDDDAALRAAPPATASVFRQRVRAHPGRLAPLRHALRSWLEQVGAGEKVTYDVVLAASEACANAIEHPILPRSRYVEVEARLLGRRTVVLSVRDTGRWRDHGQPSHRGRGLAYIDALMDHAAVERTFDGTEIKMWRDLRPGQGA